MCAEIYLENNLNFAHLFRICSRTWLMQSAARVASLWLRFSLRNWRQPTVDCGQTFCPAKVARTMWGLDNLYGAATGRGCGMWLRMVAGWSWVCCCRSARIKPQLMFTFLTKAWKKFACLFLVSLSLSLPRLGIKFNAYNIG